MSLTGPFFPHFLACDLELPTSSLIPVSRSIMTQASIGTAISRPLRLRCSSRGVPKAGFSVHLSKLESIKTLSRISTKPLNYSPGKKRRKPPEQHRNVQTTAGVLQPLIGKVPWIMRKEQMRLLVGQEKNTSASFWMEYHTKILYITGITNNKPQHKVPGQGCTFQ